MRKYLLFPLALGNFLCSFHLATWAGTLTFSDTIDFQRTNWLETLTIPQYNPADYFGQPLTGITISVTAEAIGSYSLVNSGNSILSYGTPSNRVGADIFITNNLLPGFTLNPLPTGEIGSGILFPPPIPGDASSCVDPQDPLQPCRLEADVAGLDAEFASINSGDFGAFTGSGNVQFTAEALTFTNVAISGSGESTSDIEAYLSLVVNYTFDDPPPDLEIDEPYLGVLSLLALGCSGFLLKSRQT